MVTLTKGSFVLLTGSEVMFGSAHTPKYVRSNAQCAAR